MEKICFKCQKIKPLNQFYKHKKMSDGHLGKCIDCAKNDVMIRTLMLRDNPEWIKKERERAREKYHRLGYKNRRIVTEAKYPWKALSQFKGLAKKHPLGKGLEHHHWNYSLNYVEDFIVLTTFEHKRLHAQMKIDIKRKIFKTKDGKWLDTKRKHINYIKKVLGETVFTNPF